MAIYRCEAKTISRGQGRSCVAAAAYRHAEKLHDERQELTHSYERKEGVEHSEIITPENAPEWTKDRETLWNHIDAAEKRKDAMTAREVLVALPRELNHKQRVEAVRSFVREEFTSRGIVADVAIHEPSARDGEKQPHAHIMVSDRALDPSQPNGLSAKKDRTLSQAEGIEAMRERWGQHCNQALERAQVPLRVNHRSLADQRQAEQVVAADRTRPQPEREAAAQKAFLLDRPPEPKIGPVAQQMDRQGRGEQAHALRDALAVRQDRAMLERVMEQWRQVKDQVRELAQAIAERARQAVERLVPSPALAGGLDRLRTAGVELARQDGMADRLRQAGQALQRQDQEQARQAAERQRQEAQRRQQEQQRQQARPQRQQQTRSRSQDHGQDQGR